jgi:hypothetical protein
MENFPELSGISQCFHATGIAKTIQEVDWAMSMHNIISMFCFCEQLVTILVTQHHCCAQLSAKPSLF